MADIKKLAPFILKWEGGLSRDKTDTASKFPCPTPYKGVYGWHTNKGVTYRAWVAVFGKNNDHRFFAMSEDDWAKIMKGGYWDTWKADLIKDQRIANTLVDWVWGSGAWGIKIPQRMLGLKIDGVVGQKTIEAINNAPSDFLQRLYQERKDFLHRIVKSNPTQQRFIKGWLNRMNDLINYNSSVNYK